MTDTEKKAVAIGGVFMALFIIVLVCIVLKYRGVTVYGNISPVPFALGLVVVYLILAFGKIYNDEVAAESLLGIPLGNLPPGPYLAFPGIIDVKKWPGTRQQSELPGEPEQVFRQDEKVPLPPGMFRPILMKFGGPDEKGDSEQLKRDPYNFEMVVSVTPVIAWTIDNATMFRKIYGSPEAFLKIMSDKAIEVCQNDFATITPAKASRELAETNRKLKEKFQDETVGTGVRIDDGYVKPFGYSHALNEAIVNVSIVERQIDAQLKKAEADKKTAILNGEGQAAARKAFMFAEALGVNEMAKNAGTSEGQITLWMQTMRDAFTNANYSIVPGGELFTAFAGISEAIKKLGGKK